MQFFSRRNSHKKSSEISSVKIHVSNESPSQTVKWTTSNPKAAGQRHKSRRAQKFSPVPTLFPRKSVFFPLVFMASRSDFFVRKSGANVFFCAFATGQIPIFNGENFQLVSFRGARRFGPRILEKVPSPGRRRISARASRSISRVSGKCAPRRVNFPPPGLFSRLTRDVEISPLAHACPTNRRKRRVEKRV